MSTVALDGVLRTGDGRVEMRMADLFALND
jgi:hypothetical protein